MSGALDRAPSPTQAPAVVASTSPAVGRAVTGLAVRQIRRGAVVVAVVAAGMSALVAVQYRSMFAGALDGQALQALAANPAIRVLFGPPAALDDPGGFTVWRTGTPVAVLVGVWAVLAATRITRGEEDTGRWDLLLAGRMRTADVVARHLAVLAAAVVVVGAAVTTALLVVGTTATGAVLHGAGIAGAGWGFAALAVLAAQLLPGRAAATGAASGAVAAALLMRMVADGADALSWLRWLTPFGLLGETQPYAADRSGPLLVLVAAALLLTAGAVAMAARRDIGSGLLTVTASRAPRTRLLRSATGFALRRALRPLTGWAIGIGAYYLLVGTLAVSITEFLAGNARLAEMAAAAGFAGLGSATGFAAALFGLLAVPVGLYGAARVAATAADETGRRSVLLFGLPISRTHLAGADTAVTTATTLLLLSAAGLAMWAGATLAGAPLGIADALAGALSVAPIALLSIGAATVALGWAPRAVLAIGALPAAGGFLLHVLAQSTGAPDWIAEISPFAHLAAVPQTTPDWGGAAVMGAVALLLTGLGVLGYTRRDLAL